MSLLTNLAVYYKFDETSGNAADSVGSNTLTNNNTTAYAAGIINNGADLERGSANFFSHTDASTFDFSGDMSVSVWLKVEADSQGFMGIVNKDNNSDADRSYLFAYNSTSHEFVVGLFPSGYSYPGYYWGTKSYTLTAGTWFYVTFVVTIANANASKVELYVNGSSQGNFSLADGTGATNIQNGTADFIVGKDWTTNYFDGIIDELGIWSRVLTSTEVTTLYNSGSGLSYPFGEGVNSAFLTFM